MWRDAVPGSCESRYVKERDSLEVDCTGCDTQPDLRRQKCLTGTLFALDGKLKIESIILSGTVVKRYSKRSVNLLLKMRSILDSLSALKGELQQRFQIEKSRKELKHCSQCQRDPRKILAGIEIAFLKDLAEFFSSLRSLLEVSIEDANPICELCLLQMKRDTLILLEEALSLRRYALKEGLGIVEG